MRIVIAEDSVLFREGLQRLLTDDGHLVTAAVGDADALLSEVGPTLPTSPSSTSGCRPT